jgi:hypothetical protein
VTLRVRTTTQRVYVDVEDECGGLPATTNEEFIGPCDQRGVDSGAARLDLLGSRQAVEADDGVLSVLVVPGVGCVFTADLPRYYPERASGETSTEHN